MRTVTPIVDWETRDDNGTGDGDVEIRGALNELTTAVNGRFDALGKRLDAIEARTNRPDTRAPNGNEGDLEKRAFTSFLRTGVERMQADETRALRLSDNAAGGYLADSQFITEIDKNIVQFSPIRAAARIVNVSTGEIVLPKRTGTLTASWVAETADRSETQPSYGQDAVSVHEIACFVDVSQKMLEDAAFDIAGELSMDFAEEFGRIEAGAFVNGDGVGKPFGFMENADIAAVNSGSASGITADALISMYFALKAPYRSSAVWMMAPETIATIAKLKNANGDYLLSMAGLNGAPTPTLLGRPIVEATDMPAVVAGETPIAFGDFATGYRIYDRVNLSVLRDPYSQATKGLVRFHARRRVGGAVRRAEAIKKLLIAA